MSTVNGGQSKGTFVYNPDPFLIYLPLGIPWLAAWQILWHHLSANNRNSVSHLPAKIDGFMVTDLLIKWLAFPLLPSTLRGPSFSAAKESQRAAPGCSQIQPSHKVLHAVMSSLSASGRQKHFGIAFFFSFFYQSRKQWINPVMKKTWRSSCIPSQTAGPFFLLTARGLDKKGLSQHLLTKIFQPEIAGDWTSGLRPSACKVHALLLSYGLSRKDKHCRGRVKFLFWSSWVSQSEYCDTTARLIGT